jgi:hypothetical protein|tara:strand:- start:498 stop:692 length:195 start_codon:yes stop_codon:yes gene_type:complete
MKYVQIAMILALVGCAAPSQLPFYYDQGMPHFEWVEPLVFQHNLETCRRADVCNAADLFGYNRF